MKIIIPLCLCLITFCEVKKPSAPQWDVTLKVPLLDETYYMEDLIDRDKNLIVDQQQQIVLFDIERKLESLKVYEYLTSARRLVDKSVVMNGSEADSVFLEHGILIENGVIKKGDIYFKIPNPFKYAVKVRAEMPDFFDKSGRIFETEYYVNPHDLYFESRVELAGFIFIPQKENEVNYFRYKLHATDVDGSSLAGDRILMTFEVAEFTFSELTAELDNVRIPIHTEEAPRVPTFSGNVHFKTVDLLVKILNGLSFNTFLDLEVLGFSDDTQTDVIRITDYIDPALRSGEKAEKLILLKDDPAVLKMADKLPTRLEAIGTMTLTTNKKIVKIYERDMIEGTISLKAPLSFKVTMIRKQSAPKRVEIHKSIRNKIEKHLNACQVDFEIENDLPFQTDVTLFIARDEANIFTHPDLKFENLHIASAIAEIVDNELMVKKSSTSIITKTLSKSDLQLFTSPQLYQVVNFVIQSDQEMPVTLHPEDWVHMTVKGLLGITVKE